MNTSILLFSLAIVSVSLLIAKASPVPEVPVQSDNRNADNVTAPIPKQHFSLSGYTAMVQKLIRILQTIWTMLAEHERIIPFEYCFVMDIINLPTFNLTIQGRLFFNYQILKVLSSPLGDVVSYEQHINNDSDMYQKLAWAQNNMNSSLEEMKNMLSSDKLIEQLLLHQDLPIEKQYHNSKLNTSSSTNNNTVLQGQCTNGVTSPLDEFRDLFEIYIGMHYAVWDLLNIQHELDPHYPH